MQRVFIELMQNTNNHAAYNVTGEKHWWLCVDYDNSMNKVYFSLKKEDLMKKTSNILWGLVLIGIGVVFGLNILNITNINI